MEKQNLGCPQIKHSCCKPGQANCHIGRFESDKSLIGFQASISIHEGSLKAQLLAWFDECAEQMTEPGSRLSFFEALTEFPNPNDRAHRLSVEHERALLICFFF
ncbi:hypothetical protein ACE3NQ_08735 [Paenibacillus terreus]|uniref:Uncharacterized protein n=1 Tax=Paenibacillus terreus TaxID=1387834 RepID=A0ABV5B7Z5_9BACL